MAATSRTISYDAILTLCLDRVRKSVRDNIFLSSAMLAALYGAYGKKKKQGKGLRLQDGGHTIRTPLMYEANSTAKSYSGYDTLDVTPQDGITAAFYTWRQFYASISISRLQERQNNGMSKVVDLLDQKVVQAEKSLMQKLGLDLMGRTVASGVWSAGNSTKDLDPLPLFFPKNPGSAVDIGEIDPSVETWWQPYVVDATAVYGSKDAAADYGYLVDDWGNLKRAMRHGHNAASWGGAGFPDLYVMDQNTYESYESSMDSQVRYTEPSNSPVSIGFESVKFKAADVIWDHFMPDIETGTAYTTAAAYGTLYGINTDTMEIVVDSGTNFINTPFVRPENQDAKTAQILTMMNLTTSERRANWMMYGIGLDILA